MTSKLASVYQRIELRRQHLLDVVSALPDQAISYSVPGKWSINQILVHLILAEQLSLRYIKKKSLGIESAGNTNIIDDVKYLLLKLSQRLPVKYKAPKVLGEDPPESLPLQEVIQRWNDSRNELKAFLETLSAEHLDKKIYKHAVAGRLNILHALDFFNEHLIHHWPQIQRLINIRH
jgi:uncharacterized damage-inducible protein DinB